MPLRDLVCCPHCNCELQPLGEAGEASSGASGFACSECRLDYPAVRGVVDFLPGRNGKRKAAQRLMETDWLVNIYEGNLWRGSRVAAWMMGISLEDEMKLVDEILDLEPSAAVLDLACGTGLYARRFAGEGPGRDIVGLDLSWPMLRWGVRKANEKKIENLAFVHGDALHLPFRDASLDAANCCGALHLLPDIRRVLSELGRVIRPGGRFATAVFRLRGWDPLSTLRRAYDDQIGLHRFRRDELERLFDQAGFDPHVRHEGGHWMIAGGTRRATTTDAR